MKNKFLLTTLMLSSLYKVSNASIPITSTLYMPKPTEVLANVELNYDKLETTEGDDSYFKHKTLILDGKIQEMTLKRIRRKEKWLYELLETKKVKLDDVFYAFYKDNQLFIIKNSDCIS